MDFQLPIKLGFDLHVFDKLHIEYQHISYGDVYIYIWIMLIYWSPYHINYTKLDNLNGLV